MKFNFWTVLGLTVLAGVVAAQFVSREDLQRLRDQAEDYLRQAGDQAKHWAERNNINVSNLANKGKEGFDQFERSTTNAGNSETYA